MPEQKDDLITKRVNDAGKVFGWIKENPLAFLCLCLTVIAGVFIYLFIDAKNENIALTIDLSKQIQDEIRLQAAPIIKEQVKEQVEPIKDGVGSITNKVDTLINSFKR